MANIHNTHCYAPLPSYYTDSLKDENLRVLVLSILEQEIEDLEHWLKHGNINFRGENYQRTSEYGVVKMKKQTVDFVYSDTCKFYCEAIGLRYEKYKTRCESLLDQIRDKWNDEETV